MGKRHFNEEWLDKPDANGQAISLWCIKKDNFTATCKLCDTHINVAYMGYSALKQHSEMKKHKGFSSTLQKVKDKEKVEEADKPKCTDSQKVLQDFFVKSSTHTSKATASSVETSDFAQDIGPSTSQTTVTEVVCGHFLVTFLLLFVNKIMFTKCFFCSKSAFFVVAKWVLLLLKMCFFFPWALYFSGFFFWQSPL